MYRSFRCWVLVLPLLGVAQPGAAQVTDRGSNSAEMSIIAFDYHSNPDRSTLWIDWEILGCGENMLPGYQPRGALTDSTQCGPFKLPVDVYFNDPSNKVFSYDPDNLPIHPIHGPQLIQELISVRTEHKLHPPGHSTDPYTFHVSTFAIDPATNRPVNITRFAFADSLGSFTTTSHVTSMARVSARGNNSTTTIARIKPWVLEVEYRPPKSLVELTMCALVKDWVLTLVSVQASLAAMRNGRVDVAAIVPHGFAALVVLGLWEGWWSWSQSLGAYLDSTGFYLQTVTVTVCSVALLRVAMKPTQTSWPPEKT